MMSSSINKNVNVERRTWDKEAYEARARSRAAAAEASAATVAGASAATVAGDADDDDAVGIIAAAIREGLDPADEKEEFLPARQGRAGPMGSQRAYLKSRARRVDLEGKLGSTEIIDPAAASATRSRADDAIGGAPPLTPASGVSKCKDGVGWVRVCARFCFRKFSSFMTCTPFLSHAIRSPHYIVQHCRVCDCFLKDSLTYLDHINGKKHQRYLGYSMRVEKSTTEEVSGVLRGLAEKKRETEGRGSGFNGGDAIASGEALDFEEVVRRKDDEALRRKADRARRREERKRREREERNGSLLLDVVEGKNAEGIEAQEGDEPVDDEEEEEADEDGGINPDIAAMMGFSGFGGSKKR
jgi:U4/U6.U5 tri-snRNP component SNU23